MRTLNDTERLQTSLERLKQAYPEAHCALEFKSAYELLVATVLSAQCTDARVNMVTPPFFKAYPTPQSLAKADIKKVEKAIYSTGFYRNKARNLKALAQALTDQFQGQVPTNLETLESLPGVGRKTANVVLGNAFGVASGIAVDTHVIRQMNLLRVVKSANAGIIEKKLKAIIPESDWINFTHYFISHGRAVCIARRPRCEVCCLNDICPSSTVKKDQLERKSYARRSVRTHV